MVYYLREGIFVRKSKRSKYHVLKDGKFLCNTKVSKGEDSVYASSFELCSTCMSIASHAGMFCSPGNPDFLEVCEGMGHGALYAALQSYHKKLIELRRNNENLGISHKAQAEEANRAYKEKRELEEKYKKELDDLRETCRNDINAVKAEMYDRYLKPRDEKDEKFLHPRGAYPVWCMPPVW